MPALPVSWMISAERVFSRDSLPLAVEGILPPPGASLRKEHSVTTYIPPAMASLSTSENSTVCRREVHEPPTERDVISTDEDSLTRDSGRSLPTLIASSLERRRPPKNRLVRCSKEFQTREIGEMLPRAPRRDVEAVAVRVELESTFSSLTTAAKNKKITAP